MSASATKKLPDGISQILGVFEMGDRSVTWAQDNDDWFIVIEKESKPHAPSKTGMSNHKDPLKAYDEFKRLTREILDTTAFSDINILN